MNYQILKCFLLILLPFFSLVVTLSCSNGTQHNVRTHTHEPKDMCKLVLEKFSQTVSDYTSCVASFARPIELCLRCRDKYVSVGIAYNYMEDFSQDNYTCKEVYKVSQIIFRPAQTAAVVGRRNCSENSKHSKIPVGFVRPRQVLDPA